MTKIIDFSSCELSPRNLEYGVKPFERRKSYAKVNLYIGLKRGSKIGTQKSVGRLWC